jgi:TPR repeat protein
MDLTVELRLADDTVVDRKNLQLTWSGGSAPAPTAPAESAPAPTVSAEPSQRELDASEVALLTKRGQDLMANGDIVAARMMFQPAAEAGDAKAAFALARTYDPLVLEKMGVKGIRPDAALAHQWYEKAKALGSTAAPEPMAGAKR